MSISSIGATPPSPPVKPAAPPVTDDHSKFNKGLAQAATEAQKSAVQIARPAAASVHIKA
jgi:hypothetical protein